MRRRLPNGIPCCALGPLLTVVGLFVGAVACAAPFWGDGDDCMIPRNFFAVVFGIMGAVAGGTFGLVVGIVIADICEGDRILDVPHAADPPSRSATLLRPAGPSEAGILLRPNASGAGSPQLLLREQGIDSSGRPGVD
jgi:hypothetical protein